MRVGALILLVLAALAGGTASSPVGRAVPPLSPASVVDQPPATPPPTTSPPEVTSASAPITRSIELRAGDTLVRALRRAGVAEPVANDVAAALARAGATLRRLKPGGEVTVTWTVDGDPIAVVWEASPWLGYTATATEGGWRAQRTETRPDVRVAVVAGEITRSLFDAVEAAGESGVLVHDLVEIFASELDFTADSRPGDRFRVLVEKRYAGDVFVDYGRILGAEYVGDGRLLIGIGWQPRNERRWRFFDARGYALTKTFLRSPLEFTRITSGYSHARLHPILGDVRPHLAIDYAAPVGTAVRAVADGIVMRAGWDGGYGISVRLRHRAAYETMYSHLSSLAPGVRSGSRVRQRQVIGYVGATGLATGPHLDFRVARSGQFVNPLKEKFLPGEPLAGAERAAFAHHARALVKDLEAAAQ